MAARKSKLSDRPGATLWERKPRTNKPKRLDGESDESFDARFLAWHEADRKYMRAYLKWRRSVETPEEREMRLAKSRERKIALGKEHIKACRKRWYEENKSHERAYNVAWFKENPDLKRAYDSKYREKNAVKLRAYFRDPVNRAKANDRSKTRYHSDQDYRLRCVLRASFRQALVAQGASKKEQVLSLLGCTIPELMDYIERQFVPGMSWYNYGRDTWHIDHIRPCASFDMTKAEDRAACWHYTNLQPLWGPENHRKSARLDWKRAA